VTINEEREYTGNWLFPTRGITGDVRVLMRDDGVVVRGRFPSKMEFAFAYRDIVAAREARVLLDPGIVCHLVEGERWYLWSRRNRKALLEGLRERGVAIEPGVERLRYRAITSLGITQSARKPPPSDWTQ
jgi:hypothetical protein